MSIGEKGENLIFLISTPRSGSTLLQQLLSNNEDVHTVPEPWVALPVLYTLTTGKIDERDNTEYNLYWTRTGVKGFIKHLPDGEEDYLTGIRKMYVYLYGRALEASGKKKFLDKGPRYFFIMPELHKIFPQSRVIVLLRNPIAVMFAIFNKWGKGDYRILRRFKAELMTGFKSLLKGASVFGGKAIIVRYEDILKCPEKAIKDVCGKTELIFDESMLTYEKREEYSNALGYQEQREEYQSGTVDNKNADKWQNFLKDPQLWRLASEYLKYLGKPLLDDMGYSYEGIRKVLDNTCPGRIRLLGTNSFRDIVGE